MTIYRLNNIIAFSAVALLAMTPEAQAASCTKAPCIGNIISSVQSSFYLFPKLLTSVAYIAAIFLSIMAVFKFKDHVDSPAQHPLSAAVKRLLAGGMMFSLPFVATSVQTSLTP